VDAYEHPFRHWIADDEFEPLTVAELKTVQSLRFEACYANDAEQGKFTLRDRELMPAVAARTLSSLRDPERIKFWSKETGIEWLDDDPMLWGGGLAVMAPGGWLQTHLDLAQHPKLKNMERRLNLVAFLNPHWEHRFGGQLILADPMGNPVCNISPKPGRLVVFETGDLSYHGVRQIAANAPPRVAVQVFYLSPIRPGASRQRALFMPSRNSPLCPKEVS
jgi:hypothetical protein